MKQFFISNAASIVTSNRFLYTPSPFARSSLLYLQKIGELTAQRPHVSSRSNLSSFLFFVVVKGTGSLVYDGKELQLSSGDIVFINCEKPYSHTTSSDNLWTLRWVHFYGSNLSSIYDKYCERGGRSVIHPEDVSDFQITWEELMKHASGDDYIRDMRINEGLCRLLTLLMEQSWHPEDKENLPQKIIDCACKRVLRSKLW